MGSLAPLRSFAILAQEAPEVTLACFRFVEDRDFNLASAYPQPFPIGGMAGLNEAWARGSAKSFAVFRAWPS